MAERISDPGKLDEEGWELLDDGRLEEALEIGRRLERLRWSGGFELQAAVFEEMDQLDDAIEVLQRGVELAGGPYFLFSRLGNYLSDARRYDEALGAYELGLACDPTDEALFRINRGLVYSRMDRDDDALGEYRSIESEIESRGEDEPIYWHLKGCIARVLCDSGAHGELATLVEPLAADLLEHDIFEDAKARTAAAYAVSLWQTDEVAASERWLARAIELDRNTWQAKWLTREKLARDLEPGGTGYFLTLEGVWPASLSDDGLESGFLTCFDVIAADEKQALEFALPFIVKAARNLLVINEIKIVETDHAGSKGIYECHPIIFFDPNGDDNDEQGGDGQ